MKTVLIWLLAICWAGIIFFLSAQSTVPVPSGLAGELLSKGAHFTEFFILAYLVFNALRRHQQIKKPLLLAVVISLIYGATDELHQLFVVGRSADVLDFLADSAGVFTLALILPAKQRL